jgi:retron-type reverse transcriptase
MKTILEPKLEREIFHPQSYGFGRPNRSVHDALREVQRMSEISLMIVGDLKLQDFSNLDPQILAQIFLKYIKPDQTFLKLFGKFCRAARAKKHLKEQAKLSLTGVTLDGILYPLLANLYLTPFDEYVDKLNFTVSNNSLSRAPHVSLRKRPNPWNYPHHRRSLLVGSGFAPFGETS